MFVIVLHLQGVKINQGYMKLYVLYIRVIYLDYYRSYPDIHNIHREVDWPMAKHILHIYVQVGPDSSSTRTKLDSRGTTWCSHSATARCYKTQPKGFRLKFA